MKLTFSYCQLVCITVAQLDHSDTLKRIETLKMISFIAKSHSKQNYPYIEGITSVSGFSEAFRDLTQCRLSVLWKCLELTDNYKR